MQLVKENSSFQAEIEDIDTRTVTYEFYKNGSHIRMLKLFYGTCFGGKDNNHYTHGFLCPWYRKPCLQKGL